jgi:hypothetical protein
VIRGVSLRLRLSLEHVHAGELDSPDDEARPVTAAEQERDLLLQAAEGTEDLRLEHVESRRARRGDGEVHEAASAKARRS